MFGKMLELEGYVVAVKTSSTDALKAFQAEPDNFDFIISDMIMPEMMGDKLAIIVRSIRPDIPIIICTGFSLSSQNRLCLVNWLESLEMC